MFEDLIPKVIALSIIGAIFFVFWLKGKTQIERGADVRADFILLYETSIWPKLLSLLGFVLFLGGAIGAADSPAPWMGWTVAALGVACIGYRYYAQRKYVFKPGVIACVRGRRTLGEFSLRDVIGFVRVDHSGGVSLLGLVTAGDAPSFMPKPGFFNKDLFTDYPGVSIVFSSEGGRVHAEALLKEVQARLPEDHQVNVHSEHHPMDLDGLL
jgi:hypothetical protein